MRNLCRILQAHLLLVFGSIPASTGYAVDPEYGVTLLISALEQANNIRNYDVIVKFQTDYLAHDDRDAKEFPPWETKGHFRQVCDRDASRYLNLAWIVDDYTDEWKVRPPDAGPQFRYTSYDQGQLVERDHRTQSVRTKTEDFGKFLWRGPGLQRELELVGIVGFPSYPFHEGADRLRKVYDDWIHGKGGIQRNTRLLADGTVLLTIEGNEKSSENHYTFDPMNQQLVKFVMLSRPNKGSELEPYVEFEVELVSINGFELPRTIKSMRLESPPVAASSKPHSNRMEAHSTATFEWLSVDMTKAEFPDTDDLGFDVQKWAKFIRIDQNELKEDKSAKTP